MDGSPWVPGKTCISPLLILRLRRFCSQPTKQQRGKTTRATERQLRVYQAYSLDVLCCLHHGNRHCGDQECEG